MRKILHANQRAKQNHKDEILPALHQEQFLFEKRTWTDVERGNYSLSDYEIWKKLIHLLRHGQHVHREDDGAVQFWRSKENLQKYFLYCPHGSDSKWKQNMAGGGGNKKKYQYCIDSSGTLVYLRALQGHSGCNLTDLTLQDNVIVQSNFLQYFYHVGCAIKIYIQSSIRD